MPLFSTTRRARLGSRVAFTLLEIIVTLVILGLAAALVAPVFRTDAPDEGLRSVLAATRESAVRRAQTLVLQVDVRGSWQIVAAGESTSIADGRFTDGTKDLRIRVNPLGACFNEGARSTVRLDAIACALTDPGTGGR